MPKHISALKYWLLSVAAIFGLSVYGRKLQAGITARIDSIWVAVVVFLSIFIILLFLYTRRKVHAIPLGLLILAFALLCLGGVAIYYKYLVPEETLHFIVFSSFGWLSSAVFGPFYGAVAVLAMAAGDEILQHLLPSRVGDLHDVVINVVSGMAGLLLRVKW